MDIKGFLPELRTMIQAPLQALMADELYSSAITFCKEAKVLREVIVIGDVTSGHESPLLSATVSLSVWGTVKVIGDGCELSRDDDYTQHSRDKITFLSSFKSVSVVVYSVPNSKGVVPDALSDYSKAICYGAASKLYSQPNRKWSDGNMSSYYLRLFTEEYRNAWREQLEQFGSFQNPKSQISYWM